MTQTKRTPPYYLEIAAALLVPASLFGFIRVFETTSSVFPAIITTLISSALAIGMRRLNVPLAISLVVSLASLIGLLVFRFADNSVLGVIPNASTIDDFSLLLEQLISDFKEQTSPVPRSDPFLATTITVGWLMAFLTDWGALRLKLAFEPALPAALIFIFASIPPINSGQNLKIASLVFGLSIALWAVAQRYSRIDSQTLLVSNNKGHTKVIAAAGLTISIVAVTLGGLFGHHLPYAGAEPLYEIDTGSKERSVTNPYIDLETRLIEQSNDSLFSVAANRRSYWRIVGLNVYTNADSNGNRVSIWGVSIGGDDNQDTRFSQPKDLPGQDLAQTIEIKSLDITQKGEEKRNVWVPAALTPSDIKESTLDLEQDEITQTITVDAEEGTTALEYTVVSNTPSYSATQLRQTSATLTPETNTDDVYLRLPNGIPDSVRQTALEITAGSTDRYDQMIALQQHFQSFDYDLQLDPVPQGKDAMEHFLEQRVGFCQQFSGTFAVMARQLGVPSRVAVGFTWGDQITNADGSTSFDVKGKHAHAWPEVWFGEELGWVPFEPTPGRGLPDASDYTGLPANQDSDVEEPEPEPEPEPEDTTSTTLPADPLETEPDEESPEDSESESESGGIFFETLPFDIETSSGFFSPLSNLPWRWLGLTFLLLSYPIGVPLFYSMRRKYRWQQIASLTNSNTAATSAKSVQLSWLQATDILDLGLNHKRDPSETTSEYSKRLSQESSLQNVSITNLADAMTTACYSPQSLSEASAPTAHKESLAVDKAVREKVQFFELYVKMLDPHRVFSRRPKMDLAMPMYSPDPVAINS